MPDSLVESNDHLNEEQFSFDNKNNTPVFVDFYAEWCSPCQLFDPIFDELKTSCGDKVDFIKIDIDKFPAIAAKFHVRSVPTLMIFKNKEEQWRMSGFLFAKDLKKIIEKFTH